jgi:hypothetical protein
LWTDGQADARTDGYKTYSPLPTGRGLIKQKKIFFMSKDIGDIFDDKEIVKSFRFRTLGRFPP